MQSAQVIGNRSCLPGCPGRHDRMGDNFTDRPVGKPLIAQFGANPAQHRIGNPGGFACPGFKGVVNLVKV